MNTIDKQDQKVPYCINCLGLQLLQTKDRGAGGCLALMMKGKRMSNHNTGRKRQCSYKLPPGVIRMINWYSQKENMSAADVVAFCIRRELGKTEEGKKIEIEEMQKDPMRRLDMEILGLPLEDEPRKKKR